MKMKTSKLPSVVGRAAQVDICPRDAGFVLSIGPVSIWLPRDAARDVVATLTRALLLDREIVKPTSATVVAAPSARGASN